MKSVINMCTYKSCQIGSSWMEVQVQRNSPSTSPLCPLPLYPSPFPFPLPLPPPPLPPSSVLSWVGGASNIKEGGGEGVEREGRDWKGNKLESLAVKFLEAWRYTHWLITMFTYHTSLSSLSKLCTAYNTVLFLATASRKVWMLTWGPGTWELIGMLCWVILPGGKKTLYHLHPEFQTWQATVCRDAIVDEYRGLRRTSDVDQCMLYRGLLLMPMDRSNATNAIISGTFVGVQALGRLAVSADKVWAA